MQLRARFIGQDGSMGYRWGKVYTITIQGNSIVGLNTIPYDSIEAFLRNWLPLKPGD